MNQIFKDNHPDTLSTTDNEYQVISNICLPDNCQMNAVFELSGVRIGGASGDTGDGYSAIITLAANNIAGNVNVIQDVTTQFLVASQLSGSVPVWRFQPDITGRNLRLRVRGATGNIINWKNYKTLTFNFF